jgi:hypothetical protein
VLFPCCPSVSCSLFLAFSSLGSACFSPIAYVCLTYFFLHSCLQLVRTFPPITHVCLAHFFSPSRL